MIICPTCGSQNESGATFCDQCGTPLTNLSNTGAPSTPPVTLPNSGNNFCSSCGNRVIPGELFCDNCGAALTNYLVASAQLVIGNGQLITLSGKPTYLIGREDPVTGIFPEIDTTSSGGSEAGVSRRHAEIIQQNAQWFLRDLSSTNGTFVNNQKLTPNERQLLHSGDQIRLGKWMTTFQARQ